MSRKPLRVVAPGETPSSRKPKSVTEAAADGNRWELLLAMRSRVATAVEDPNTPAKDLAALTRRLMEIAKDIEALEASAGEVESESNADDTFDASAI